MLISSVVAGLCINCELTAPMSWIVLLSWNVSLNVSKICPTHHHPTLPLCPEAVTSARTLFASVSGDHPSGHWAFQIRFTYGLQSRALDKCYSASRFKPNTLLNPIFVYITHSSTVRISAPSRVLLPEVCSSSRVLKSRGINHPACTNHPDLINHIN
jgi:hypothetical protein